jgi:DNA-directed RNA polymerase specialized sigma subunit
MVLWVLGRLPAWVKARMAKGDLEQAGWLGLMNAYRLYDPDKGVKFSTYAIHKIRWAMLIEAGLTNHGWPPPTVEYDDGRRHEL